MWRRRLQFAPQDSSESGGTNSSDLKLRVRRATVQVSHPGFGMGVQFSLNTADEREQVKQLIACQPTEDSLA